MAADFDQLPVIKQLLRQADEEERFGELRVVDSDLLRRIPWLVSEVEQLQRLRSRLTKIEWAATAAYVDGEAACPVCENWRSEGRHAPDCWLAAELRAEHSATQSVNET